VMRWRVKKVTVVQKNDVTPIANKEHHADARSHPTRVNCRTFCEALIGAYQSVSNTASVCSSFL
jgi:hypothetical protein